MRSRFKTRPPLLLLAMLVLCGCRHRPHVDGHSLENDYHWMSWEVYEAEAKNPVFEKELALEIIYDDAEEDSWRRLMVFYLFESLVRPGWTSRDFGALFKDPIWIDGAQLTPVFALGGQISVELPDDSNETDFVFVFIPFARNRGASPGAITMSLGGLDKQFGFTNEAEAVALAKSFLGGDLEFNNIYLVEFAMRNPDRLNGVTELFTKRGHGLKP